MRKGRILKVRPGHEANCSSGMVALVMLVGAAVTLLPASLIVAGVQAANLGKGKSPSRRGLYWIVPLVVGVLATVLGCMFVGTSGFDSAALVAIVLGIGGSFILACLTGYVMAPRMGHPYWLLLLAPVILVAGSFLSAVSAPLALLLVGAGLVILVASGLNDGSFSSGNAGLDLPHGDGNDR